MTEYWRLSCEECGYGWDVECYEGEHCESCPRCGATLVMDGDSIEYVEVGS
jgi:uncharacterized paraquat-inducible protein A